MKKDNPKKSPPKEEEAQEWDLSAGLGILPDDVSLTQNLGCASGKSKGSKPKSTTNQANN